MTTSAILIIPQGHPILAEQVVQFCNIYFRTTGIDANAFDYYDEFSELFEYTEYGVRIEVFAQMQDQRILQLFGVLSSACSQQFEIKMLLQLGS